MVPFITHLSQSQNIPHISLLFVLNFAATLLRHKLNTNQHMKKILMSLCTALASLSTAIANDGVYFTSGNFLVPAQETDIAASKEILTITIGQDNFATVDVYYEFINHGEAKKVKMAFEAMPPYNDNSEPLNRRGVHPYIKDFTVRMNGEQLSYSNSIVAFANHDNNKSTEFTPLDMTKWKGYGEVPDDILPAEDALYNAELDSITAYAYAYCFDAPFKAGLNIVHHTYRYHMSYNVAEDFVIPYWLTPVNRWANHQVDDFTLRISAEGNTELCLTDTLFSEAPFTSANGGKIYNLSNDYDESFIFTSISKGDTILWHGKNFHPAADMSIHSPSWSRTNAMNLHSTSAKVAVANNGNGEARYLADCGDCYFVDVQDYGLVKKNEWHVENYDAAKGQGWLIIDSNAAKKVNIRKRPSTKSKIIDMVEDIPNEMPEALPCIGLVTASDGNTWFMVKANGQKGYIRSDLMIWDAINTY